MDKPSLSDQADRATITGTRIAFIGLIIAAVSLYIAWPTDKTTATIKINEDQFKQLVPSTKQVVAQPPAIAKLTTPPAPKSPPATSEENNPLQLTDKQSRFSELADADVSAVFNNFQGRQFAKLTVAAAGKEPVFLPIHGAGQSLTFESKTGEYIASVLSVDFDSKTLEVRVAKKN